MARVPETDSVYGPARSGVSTGAHHDASAPAEYSVHRGRRLWLCVSWLHRPDRLPDPVAGPACHRGDPFHSGLCQFGALHQHTGPAYARPLSVSTADRDGRTVALERPRGAGYGHAARLSDPARAASWCWIPHRSYWEMASR